MQENNLILSARAFVTCLDLVYGGDMGAYGIAVLSFFSSCISVILILTCSIALSFSPAVCGFSSFWVIIFGKFRRSFTLLWYHSFGSPSSAGQYLKDFRLNGKWLHNFWLLIYSTMKLVGHPMTGLFDHCTDQFDVFLRFLTMTEVDFWCLHSWDKITCEMDTTLSKHDPS